MNLVDFYVTKVLDEPTFEYNKWWLRVKAISYGSETSHTLMFKTKEEAMKVEKGYVFKG